MGPAFRHAQECQGSPESLVLPSLCVYTHSRPLSVHGELLPAYDPLALQSIFLLIAKALCLVSNLAPSQL